MPFKNFTTEDLKLIDEALIALLERKQLGHDIMITRLEAMAGKENKKALKELELSSQAAMAELREKVSTLKSRIKSNVNDSRKSTNNTE